MPTGLMHLLMFLITILQITPYYLLCCKSMKRVFPLKISFPVFSLTIVTFSVINVILQGPVFARVVCFLTTIGLNTFIQFKARVSKKIVIYVLLCIIYSISDLSVAVLFGMLKFDNGVTYQFAMNIFYILVQALYMLLLYFVVENIYYPDNMRSQIFFCFIPITQIATIIFLCYQLFKFDILAYTEIGIVYNGDTFTSLSVIILTFVTLIADIIYLRQSLKSLRSIEEKRRLELLELESKASFEYYSELRDDATEMRKFRHDINNILTSFFYLLNNPDEHTKDELQIMGSELRTQINDIGLRKFCDNNLINCILAINEKRFTAQGIECDFTAAIPDRTPISELDLCRIITNLLDNAHNALIGVPDAKIRFDIRVTDGFLYINQSNPYVESDSKKSDNEHGHGMGIINDIAHKYNGSFDAEVSGDTFKALVAMECGN